MIRYLTRETSIAHFVRRLVCRLRGHAWTNASAEPVIGPFFICWRCGRWFR